MRGSGHENGAASAAPETTPTIGQRPVPVCLQCVTGAVDLCGVQRTCAGGACQGGAGALAAWGVDDHTASLRRAGDQAGAHEVVHNLLKPCCIGVQGLAVSAGVEVAISQSLPPPASMQRRSKRRCSRTGSWF